MGAPPPIDGALEGSPGYNALRQIPTAAERLEAAIPDAIAQIERAALNPTLNPAELADLQASIDTLRSGGIQYRFEAIRNQPTAAGGAKTENGRSTITINPSAPTLFYSDGSVNIESLARFLVHEGRHVYDNQVYSLQNGPSNIDEVRRTERNAYRTQAAYERAVGMVSYTVNPMTGATVPFSSATSNFAAERSVVSWVNAAAISATEANSRIDRNYQDYLNRLSAHDARYGTHTTPLPRQPYVPVPTYSPPSSY
ncbi:MAG TPA: hypothetical protein VEA80_00880 [Vitreimonas sp.]|uniref:hypothetical protein n=1 Tax=Vitreimonas sp. TaxID=3069702 RepID=UPI002D30F88C|nr:hypothetical protein [Vitreimonas sp.]HYD86005.1 hypothetical protein [Vitreimonas sp.]